MGLRFYYSNWHILCFEQVLRYVRLAFFSYLSAVVMSAAQTNFMGKTIWPLGGSPSSLWNPAGTNSYPNFKETFHLPLNGDTWGGVSGGLLYFPPSGPFQLISGGRSQITANTPSHVLIQRTGENLFISIDGVQRYNASTNLVSGINRLSLWANHGNISNSIDYFSLNGVTNNFTSTNSTDWVFYNEIQNVGQSFPNQSYLANQDTINNQQTWNDSAANAFSGITGGNLLLRAGTPSMMIGNAIADFQTPLSGDFTIAFSISRNSTGFGNFYVQLLANVQGTSSPTSRQSGRFRGTLFLPPRRPNIAVANHSEAIKQALSDNRRISLRTRYRQSLPTPKIFHYSRRPWFYSK